MFTLQNINSLAQVEKITVESDELIVAECTLPPSRGRVYTIHCIGKHAQGAPLVHKIVSFVFVLFPRSYQMSPTYVDGM